MAVRKPCRSRGCKSSPRCEHPWWLDVMYNRERYRMPVDDFALARGATAPVTSKQEAEKVWEPKFIAEIVSGKDPRVPIERETKFERPTTVADLLKLYRTRYVEVEPLKSRAGMLSQLNVLSAHLGALPATALERPDAIEDFKKRYANRAIATTNRYLARLRHVCNWAIGRDLLSKTAFHPRGVRIPAKAERRRERRVSEAEEQRLLEACKLLNEPTRSMAKLTWDDVHEIRARAQAGIEQREIATAFKISRPLCSAIVRGHIWNPDPQGALENRSRTCDSVRGRQSAREALAPTCIPRTGCVRVRRGNNRRVRGQPEVSLGDAAAAGQRHQADARRKRQASLEPQGTRADRPPLARPPT